MNKELLAIRKLTNSNRGHMIHHNSVFSPDGQWIVFDGRNDETKIIETSSIGLVDVHTGNEKIIYEIDNASPYGPGVGAASFSPVVNKVIFIHGLYEANENEPYDISRRFGLAIDVDQPHLGIPMDARDVLAPYTLGTLRGGTHSHCWSPEGQMLSFTYNDALVDADLRMVGVMIPHAGNVAVPKAKGNVNGTKFAVILTDVVRDPLWGSDEINKAFDECWLNTSPPTIAFQGNTINSEGQSITEIYTVVVDSLLIQNDKKSAGALGKLPQVPKGIQQKRISYTKKGLSNLRHWLRASPDGRYVYALAKDDQDKNQIIRCTVATGEFEYISDFQFSISSPININAIGDKLSFIAENNVYIFDLLDSSVQNLTHNSLVDSKIIGAAVFSPKENVIAFNILKNEEPNVQIYLVNY